MLAAAILVIGLFSTVGLAQEEEQQQETTQPDTENPAPAPSAEPAAAASPSLFSSEPREAKVFGAYRLRLAGLIPSFSDELKLYDELYGNEKAYPELHADYLFFDWYLTFGVSLRGGYYVANGNALKAAERQKDAEGNDESDESFNNRTIAHPDGNSGRLIIDTNAPTTLTLIPLKVLATAQFTPFSRKYVVVEGWAGFEALRFQEVRGTREATATTTTTTTTTTAGAGTAAAEEDKGKKTNSGMKYGTVFGGALNILLNPLDDRSPRSLESTLGFGYCYLSPFFEAVLSISDGADFSRTVLGVGFTFESVR